MFVFTFINVKIILVYQIGTVQVGNRPFQKVLHGLKRSIISIFLVFRKQLSNLLELLAAFYID